MRSGRSGKLAFVALAILGAATLGVTDAGSATGLGAAPNSATSPGCGGIASADIGFSGDRAATASAINPELSMFVAAVEAAGLTYMLDGDEQFTIFAPNDAAFEKIPDNVLASILDDRELLASILTYHVLPESRSSAALAEAGTATTLNGGELSFALDGEALTINGYQAAVVCADLAVARSTVHVIDSFLLPAIDDLVDGVASSGPGSGPTTVATTSTTTTSPPTTGPTAVTTTSDPGVPSTSALGVSPTSDPGGTTTSTIGGSTTSLAVAGAATLPGTGSSSVAQQIALGAALLLALGGLFLAVTRRRRHA